MSNVLTPKEWANRQDFVILAEDRIIGVKNPIFYSGIKVSTFLREVPDPKRKIDPFGPFQPHYPPPELPKFETAFRIEFECAGAAAAAFYAEFLKLVDKYNHLEQSVYLCPNKPKKTPVWKEVVWKKVFRRR